MAMHTIRGSRLTKFRILICSGLLLCLAAPALAGGGLVLENDTCILRIDFYSAHFTAYQPEASGNQQFCRELPATGATLFVLDYLHQTLKEVPVSLRVVRDYTGQGRFVKLAHLGDAETIEQNTVFYQPPVVRPDASLAMELDLRETGAYVGIVTAGHPSNGQTYTTVFPFRVGASAGSWLLPALVVAALAAGGLLWRRRRPTAAAARDAIA
jgi:hypothetical protein